MVLAHTETCFFPLLHAYFHWGGAMRAEKPKRVTQLFHRDEIRALLKSTNWEGAFSVATSWGIIIGAFVLAAWRPNPLTLFIALLLLGGRHLALAVLMHEAAHRSLFASEKLNHWVGTWLCAAPSWNHLEPYRKHHVLHHAHTNSAKDPDLGLVEPFPVTRRSLLRKLTRDIIGITGVKRVFGQLLMAFGYLHYPTPAANSAIHPRTFWQVLRFGLVRLGPVVVFHAILFTILAAFGESWLFVLWVVAWLSPYSLFLRMRSMAEHACTARSDDPFQNTRTTHANWLARLFVAPHHVNYHLEHHLLMTVPHYRLKRMHRLLLERGHLADTPPTPNYRTVLRLVSSRV